MKTQRLTTAQAIIRFLLRQQIERDGRRQPFFAGCRARGGAVAAHAFERGLCLPSGSNLTEADRERICAVVREVAVAGCLV